MNQEAGAICGGVVSESEFLKNPDVCLMCFIMPDDAYKRYEKLLKEGKEKEASDLFKKYAWSVI